MTDPDLNLRLTDRAAFALETASQNRVATPDRYRLQLADERLAHRRIRRTDLPRRSALSTLRLLNPRRPARAWWSRWPILPASAAIWLRRGGHAKPRPWWRIR